MSTDVLQSYLKDYEGLMDYDIYSPQLNRWILADEFPNQNDPQAWVSYAVAATRRAWGALPPEIRDMALDALNEALDQILEDIEGLGSEIAAQVGGALEDSVTWMPVLGWVIEILVFVVEEIVGLAKKLSQADEAMSIWKRTTAQYITMAASSLDFYEEDDPSRWLFNAAVVENYPRYYKVGDRINGVGTRLQPCMTPIQGDEGEVLYGWVSFLQEPTGYNAGDGCVPGLPIKSVTNTDPKKGVKDKDPCKSYIQLTPLFYPFWSTNHPAIPITVYTDDIWPDGSAYKPDPRTFDPNTLLIARQTAMLADPQINFQMDGEELREYHAHFVDFFKDSMRVVQVMMRPQLQPGTFLVRRVTNDGRLSQDFGGDVAFVDPAYDEQTEADTIIAQEDRFYLDDQGLIRAYRGDPALWGVQGPISWIRDGHRLAVTVAQYNTVHSQTRAFFTARQQFLTNPHYMKSIKEAGGLDRYDPPLIPIIEGADAPIPTIPSMPGVYYGEDEPGPGGSPGGFKARPLPPKKPKKKKKTKQDTPLVPVVLGAAAVGTGVWLYRRRGGKKKAGTKAMAKLTKQQRNILIAAGVIAGVGFVGYQLMKKDEKPKKNGKKNGKFDPKKLGKGITQAKIKQLMQDEWDALGNPIPSDTGRATVDGQPLDLWTRLTFVALSAMQPDKVWPETASERELWVQQASKADRKTYNRYFEFAKEVAPPLTIQGEPAIS